MLNALSIHYVAFCNIFRIMKLRLVFFKENYTFSLKKIKLSEFAKS